MQSRIDLWSFQEYSYPLAYGFRPNLVPFLHEDSQPRPGIIVVPGGGYCFVSPTESTTVAERFFSMGYNAFVLSYTTDLTFTCPLKLQPMQDLSRAIRLVRARAEELRVIPDQLAICGFSAGGHLCASICVHHMDIRDPDAALQQYSNCPNAAILSYPLISSVHYTHRESMLALLGEHPSEEELDYAANERHVSAQTPPCFLWHTVTDQAVHVENSLFFAQACREAGVPFAMHLFSDGPHGLSTSDAAWVGESWKADYVLEQSYAIIEQIRQGNLKHVPSNWTIETFLAHGKNVARDSFLYDAVPNKEVAVWPQIAHSWLQQLFQKDVTL